MRNTYAILPCVYSLKDNKVYCLKEIKSGARSFWHNGYVAVQNDATITVHRVQCEGAAHRQ